MLPESSTLAAVATQSALDLILRFSGASGAINELYCVKPTLIPAYSPTYELGAKSYAR